MPSHFLPDRPTLLEGNAVSDRPGGGPAWLKEKERSSRDERRRDTGRLASTWCGNDDDGARALKRVTNLVDRLVDWQRLAHKAVGYRT
jgi:hypothetical protein